MGDLCARWRVCVLAELEVGLLNRSLRRGTRNDTGTWHVLPA